MNSVLNPEGLVPVRPQPELTTPAKPDQRQSRIRSVTSTSPALPIAAYPPGVEEYLRILAAKDGLRRLHRSVLRAASIDARELQAAHATQRALTWDGLRNALLRYCAEGTLDPGVDSILAQLPPLPVMTLARVVALQNLRPADRRIALALYGRLLAHHGPRAFKKPHAKLLLDLAFQFSDRELVKQGVRDFKLDPLERASLTADLLNPARAVGQQLDESAWLDAINACTDGEGTARIALMPEGTCAFDRLDTTPVAAINSGPKVTVAITAWCPDEGLVTAFRSIARQTWRNLEILVMDDDSPEQFVPLLRAVVASDPRARLIRMPKNGGTYVARNRALDEATGEFFTVHDSDDWAHPERVERQVKRLIENPALMSTSSRALRADDDLVFNLPGVSASRENASSLMFRRREVMDAIGYYDRSRKGADTEYALRMLKQFGEDSHVTLEEHLAFIRLTAGSLSRDEFKPGWRHPSRMTYRLGYQWLHADRTAAGLPLYFGRHGEEAQFSRPVRFLVDRDSDEARRRRRWDVLYVLDLRATAEQPASFLDELLELARAGRTVAVMHMESLLFPLVAEVEPYVPELQGLISTGVVGEVLFTDEAQVATVVIRDPSSLQFAASTRAALSAGRVLVLPEGLPERAGATSWTYSVAEVEDHAYRVFGREAEWLMDDAQIAACESCLNAPRKVIHRTWRMVAGSPLRWRAPRPARDGSPLRIGRVVTDRYDVESLSLALEGVNGPAVEQVSIFACLEAEGSARAAASRAGWRVETGSHPEDIFYAQLDVFLLHGARSEDPAQVRHAMQAAASGAIVLGDGSWRDMLGDTLCCDVKELPAVCTRIRTSKEADQRYRSQCAQWLASMSGAERFVQTLAAS